MLSASRSTVARCGNQEAHFVAAPGLRLSWTICGLPLSYSAWFGQFPCETLSKQHRYLSLWVWPPWLLSEYTAMAISLQHPLHNYTPPIAPTTHGLACGPALLIILTSEVTITQWKWTCMFVHSNNLIKAGGGIDKETKCWSQWLLWLLQL